jgi:MSHA biogenesis protein MshN
MSVINKMLQDLEQRQPAQTTASNSSKVPAPDSSRSQIHIWMVLLVLLVLLGGFWFSKNQPLQTEPVSAVNPAAAASAEPRRPVIEQGEQHSTGQAEPAAIMTALDTTNAATDAVTGAAIASAVAAPAEDAAVNLAAIIAAEPAEPAAPDQLIVVATEEPALSAVARPQASIDKQPLSVAAQQHNMQLRANASEAAGDTGAAVVIWQQIVALQPAEAEGYLNLARLWLKQQQIVTASQVLLQARQNGVISAEINMQLAQLAVRQGQWQQALEFLSDQFELAAEPEYFGFKATVLQQLQQHAAALSWYQRLQQLQPEQGRWSLGAAVASEQLGQPLQAHQYYQHAWQYRQALSVSSHNFIQQRLKATEP